MGNFKKKSLRGGGVHQKQINISLPDCANTEQNTTSKNNNNIFIKKEITFKYK